MILRKFLLFIALFGVGKGYSQDSTFIPKLQVSGFIDVFYAYDFNRPTAGFRQPFFYNHNRHNEFNINLGLLKVGVEHAKYRANLALQAGTYAKDNYAAEQDMLKHVFEANVGLSLNKKNKLWLDAGIFASHLGFESAISSENPTLTRSLVAENSPYFLSGAKLSYAPGKNWEMAVLVCNGWQRIQRLPGNSLASIGTQLSYSKNEKVLLNWSTFIGTDSPDSTRQMRYFNNVYGKFQLSKGLSMIAGFDIGFQQQSLNSTKYARWFSPILISRYAWNEQWAMALRAEYYEDRSGVIIETPSPGGFRTTAISLNLDYSPWTNVLCRIEGRWLNAAGAIFPKDQGLVNDNVFVTASVAIGFGSLLGQQMTN